MKNQVTQTVVVFVALLIAYAVLIVIAKDIADNFGQSLLLSTGTAILGSGLTFFLLRMFQIKK